jgi:hypothetical protein
VNLDTSFRFEAWDITRDFGVANLDRAAQLFLRFLWQC